MMGGAGGMGGGAPGAPGVPGAPGGPPASMESLLQVIIKTWVRSLKQSAFTDLFSIPIALPLILGLKSLASYSCPGESCIPNINFLLCLEPIKPFALLLFTMV